MNGDAVKFAASPFLLGFLPPAGFSPSTPFAFILELLGGRNFYYHAIR